MHLNIRVAAAALMLGAVSMPVAARESRCAGISDYQARAACQTQDRRGYGASLERALFKTTSSDGNIFVQEVGDPGSGAYPRLVIWATLLTEDKMNELIAKGAILDGARQVGFRTLVFVDKGQDRNWYFDLTKPANSPLDIVSPPSPAWMKRSSR